MSFVSRVIDKIPTIYMLSPTSELISNNNLKEDKKLKLPKKEIIGIAVFSIAILFSFTNIAYSAIKYDK